MKNLELACIVDDDPIYSFVAKKMIETHSFAIETINFENGKAALEGLSALMEKGDKLPDVILLDLNMPVMDGWEFLNAYQSIHKNPVSNIFIVSSSIDLADTEKADTYSIVNGFISKPLTEDSFKQICDSRK